MKCDWLKNESNYFVPCKYFQLILQPLQVLTRYKIMRLILQPRAFHYITHRLYVLSSLFSYICIYIYMYIDR